MKDFLKLQSTSTISYYLKKLEKEGIISLNSAKNRSLTLNNKYYIYEILDPFHYNIFSEENVIKKYPMMAIFNINSDCFFWKAAETTEQYSKNDILLFAIKNAKINDYIMVNDDNKPLIKRISNINEKYSAVLCGIYRHINIKKR